MKHQKLSFSRRRKGRSWGSLMSGWLLIFERDWQKFLGFQIVEPICKRAICPPEKVLVSLNRILVALMMIRCCNPGRMNKIGQGMLALTFARVYSCHWTSLIHLWTLISQTDNVINGGLKVKQALLRRDMFYIARLWWLIRPVSLLLHLWEL
jgi:hypothetical protein